VVQEAPRLPARGVEPAPAPAVKSDDGIDWATVALGIAGSMIAVVGIALVTSRRRMPPLRPSA